jgi:hypothetical protein
VRAQVELLSVQVLTKVFQCPHYGKQFPSGDAVISLGFVQCLMVVSIERLNRYKGRYDVNDSLEQSPWEIKRSSSGYRSPRTTSFLAISLRWPLPESYERSLNPPTQLPQEPIRYYTPICASVFQLVFSFQQFLRLKLPMRFSFLSIKVAWWISYVTELLRTDAHFRTYQESQFLRTGSVLRLWMLWTSETEKWII